MKPTTRRSIIAGTVLAVFSGSASYAQGKETAPGQLRKTPRATPTDVGPGGASFTNTPSPTLPPSEWTATPSSTASASSTLTRTPAPTKTPVPPTATVGGAFPYAALPGERTQLLDEINRSRAEVGVPPLSWHQRAADVAQWRCEDMEARRFSAHQVPAGACFEGRCWSEPIFCWDVLTAIGVHWQNVGENLWLGPSLEHDMAETSNRVFAGSGSHYAAMIEPAFTHCGIGMAFCSWANGCHVVEIFLRPATADATFSLTETSLTQSSDGRLSQARARRR
jgi:uncharacterized protein YkwD